MSDLLILTKKRYDIKHMISEQEKNGLMLELYRPEHMDEEFNTFVRIEMTEMLKPGGHYRFLFEEKVRINCIHSFYLLMNNSQSNVCVGNIMRKLLFIVSVLIVSKNF